ncbi:complex III assembly factor LYRM7 [Anoplophora glabripennis]|uniref:complex III assembly factor LYRM7 n=1 Tax=Anoplophora glabripennis TaxID=217634 RepID=UPI0008737123|nr:complex III assembly factor LYRM7 [Anoplophora glabripennis]
MSTSLRHKVLQSFKQLHQARRSVFKGDTYALTEARKRINEEFKKNKHVKDVNAIDELINYANAVEREIRTCVIQAREVEPGRFQVQITKDTVQLDNVPFSDCPNEKSKNEKS